MIEIILRTVIIFTCIMVVGCGIVFFFLIKRAKATYCEKEEETWEVVERKYLRKRNRVVLLYTCILILFYLLIYFWLKGNGIPFPKEEKIFFLMYFLIFFPITFYIELNYRNMERWKIEEQNLSQLKGINYLLERRSIQKGRTFSFLFAFMIVVGIFLITEEDFLFTGASNKTKVIDMQGTTIEQNAFDSTLKSDTYNKFMDYNSFLEFDGIIQTGDFNGDGNEDYLIKSPLANTSETVYYIQFYGSERELFLGAYEWGYLLSVECVDVDNNGSKELIVMGTNDHTYSVEESSETFIRFYQNIGTAQHIIGEVITTIVYHSKDGLKDYSVKKIEFVQK